VGTGCAQYKNKRQLIFYCRQLTTLTKLFLHFLLGNLHFNEIPLFLLLSNIPIYTLNRTLLRKRKKPKMEGGKLESNSGGT